MIAANELEAILLTGTAGEVRALRCPTCGGPLRAIFSNTERGMALNISCAKRCYRANLDGFRKVPPWVSELGPILQTE